MSKKLSKLTMTIALLDKLSGPMRGVMGTIDNLERRAISSFASIGKGMATLAATAAVTTASLLPAGDVYAALGEVKSLGVAQSGLTALRHESARFAIAWGEDSGTFIRSAYDIKSAISSLGDEQMPRVTRAAGILAKATKANVSDMTSYFGSLYGIFQKQADKMGAATWLEDLAGKTASAVQMFKTTGPGMQRAFENLGAEATAMGVTLDEQMAILGRMQSMMSGSEAGTQYRAFLQGVGHAETQLGLRFTGDDGRMLSALTILQRIESQFGDIAKVADSDLLKKAFGSTEATAFIKALVQQREKLRVDIDLLGGRDGLDTAIEMAEAMTTPWERIMQGSKALTAAFGFGSLREAIPMLDRVADGMNRVLGWTVSFEHLTQAVSGVLAAVLGLGLALGGLWVGIGLVKLLGLALLPLAPLLGAVTLAFTALRLGWVMFIAAKASGLGILAAARIGMMGFLGALHMNLLGLKLYRAALWLVMAPFKLVRLAFLSLIPAVWGFTVALLANPITWIVLAIGALIGVVVAAVVYWEQWTAAIGRGWHWLMGLFQDNAWLQTLLFPLYAGMELIDLLITQFNRIPQWWSQFNTWLGSLDLFGDFFGNVLGLFDGLFNNLFNNMISGVNTLIDQVNLIPGINMARIDLLSSDQSMDATVKEQQAQLRDTLPNISQTDAVSVPEGGLMQHFLSQSSQQQKTLHVDKVELHNHGQGVNAQDFLYQLEMEAG